MRRPSTFVLPPTDAFMMPGQNAGAAYMMTDHSSNLLFLPSFLCLPRLHRLPPSLEPLDDFSSSITP